MAQEIDDQDLFTNVLKLLNKAGNDRRLTPRILRKKLEERMKLPEGGLKSKRELIKTHIFKWFKKTCADEYQKIVDSVQPKKVAPVVKEMSIEEKTLNQLGKLAKGVGKSNLFSAVKDADIKSKIKTVSGKLQELGYKFSSCPTDGEIKEAIKKYQSQQALLEVDKSLILTPGKKRASSGIPDQHIAKKPNNNGNSNTTITKKYTDDDEEADF